MSANGGMCGRGDEEVVLLEGGILNTVRGDSVVETRFV